jgi:hypothetical protein
LKKEKNLKLKASMFIIFALLFLESINSTTITHASSTTAPSINEEWSSGPIYATGGQPIENISVGEPFGVCHGDPLVNNGGDGNDQLYNINWNRKDLPWSQIERVNGSFCFNGYTVEDEPHSYKHTMIVPLNNATNTTDNGWTNGTIVTIRLNEIRNTTGDNFTAYFSNDTAKINNLVDTQINSTSFNITMAIPTNLTLFVTYNKTPAHSVYLYEDFIWNHKVLNISYIPILDYSNPYLFKLFPDEYEDAGFPSRSNTYIPKSGLWNWRRFVRRVVSRYSGFVDQWEIWNEPNNQYIGKENWLQFLEVAKVAAEEINASDPTAKIYFGGLGGTDEMEFLEFMFDNLFDNKTYFDVFDGIAFHPYTRLPEGLLTEKMDKYFEILNSNNWTRKNNKEFLITEIGFPTNGTGTYGNSLDPQYEMASKIVKNMAMAADIGIEVFIWYCYKDDSSWVDKKDYLDSEFYFGLFEQDMKPKKGAYAFNLSSFLFSNSISRRNSIQLNPDISLIKPEENFFTYNFRKADGTDILVLWNIYGVEIDVSLTIPSGLASSMRSHSFFNNSTKILASPTNESTTIKLTSGYDPIIISFKSNKIVEYFVLNLKGDSYTWFKFVYAPIILGLIGVISTISILIKVKTAKNKTVVEKITKKDELIESK